MKKRRYFVAAVLILVLMLTGCGASSDKNSAATESAPMAMSEAKDEAYYTVTEESIAEEPTEMEMGDAGAGATGSSGIDSVKTTSQKLIKTVNLSMETKEFDTLMTEMSARVEELGGYIENSEISGNSYSSSRNRYAWLRLRIPADRLDGFISIVGEMGNITYKNEYVEDITLQYVDVQSHKIALETEQSRLLSLLENAENMEDIIQIETRLSEIRYELQSYESRLRTMDNQVSYSTVTVDIQEVQRITEVEEKTYLEEVTYRLSNNFYSIGQDLRDFSIWFLSSLPYLVIWALAITAAVVILRKLIRRKRDPEKKRKWSDRKGENKGEKTEE